MNDLETQGIFSSRGTSNDVSQLTQDVDCLRATVLEVQHAMLDQDDLESALPGFVQREFAGLVEEIERIKVAVGGD